MNNKFFSHTLTLSLLCTLGVYASGFAADWPQFQGLQRDGSSPETGLAHQWPKAGPETLWTIPLGEGYGGPSIVAGQVYVLDRVDNEQDVLRCLDLNTGKEQWTFAYNAMGKLPYNGSRSTPTVADGLIYTVGPLGDVYCISAKTHRPVWQAHLMKDFDAPLPTWGFSQSVVIHGELAIVAPQGEKAGMVAYDRKSGKIVWQTPPMRGGAAYATPVIWNLAGKEQVLLYTSKTELPNGDVLPEAMLYALDPADGKTLWTYDGWQCKRSIVAPLKIDDNRIFITGGYEAGSAMVRVEKTDGKFVATELYKTDVCGSQLHQPLLIDNHLYIGSNDNSRRDGLACMTLDGKMLWQTTRSRKLPNTQPGLPAFERGNYILADGMIYIMEGDKGNLHLIAPSPEGYKELASVEKILSGRFIWANMALSNGKLVLRDQTQMKCLDVAK